MASGDFVVFDQYLLDLGNKIMDMDTDTFNFALIKSLANGGADPAATDPAPHFGGTGTTNYALAEVTAGGNYSAGGSTLANNTWTVATSVLKFDFDNVSILKNAANPTNARWAIVYDFTDTNKRCVGFLDLGSDKDLTAGDFSYTVPPTNGVFRIGVGTIT